MIHEEKIQYMKIATAICGYGFETGTIDLFVSLYDKIVATSGDTDLRSILAIQQEVSEKYKNNIQQQNPEHGTQ